MALLAAFGLTVLTAPADATAQTNVVSLPGDVAGAKLPFQVGAGIYMTNDCGFPLEFDLPAGEITIETVTADITVQGGHAPTLFLATEVAGQSLEHKIALEFQISVKDSATNTTDYHYQATRLVRLHHHSETKVPLDGGLALGGPGSCPFAIGGVSIAGYYRPAP